MTADLPDHYFRVRENGAAVFRLSTENRQRRIEMAEIATVNVKNGNIKPHGDVVLSLADLAAIMPGCDVQLVQAPSRLKGRPAPSLNCDLKRQATT